MSFLLVLNADCFQRVFFFLGGWRGGGVGEGVLLRTFSRDVQFGFPNPNPISDRDIFSGSLFQA